MNDVVIVSAARTAIGKSPRGSLRETRPDDLAAEVLKAVLERASAVPPESVEDVILGCATPEAEQGLNVARIAALRAGLPLSTPGLTINRFCASGLEAIAIAAAKIATGQAETIIAGGTESMTMVPFMGDSLRPNAYLQAHQPDTYCSMGDSVENLSQKFGITREAADMFALESQLQAITAQDAGRFDEEIVPIKVSVTETDAEGNAHRRDFVFDRDEGPRRETTLEGLAKLKTPFRENGVITAGNASQRSDGAAAVLLTTARNAERLGLTPLARFVGYAVTAVTPEDFGIAPAYAIPKLLEKTGIHLDDIDLIEFNEAFAAQVLAAHKIYPLPMDRVNVNGGAVALGHPLGATGARQTVTLLHEGRFRGARYGIVTMCAALGMGAAALFELL